jgi:hypothetical protein
LLFLISLLVTTPLSALKLTRPRSTLPQNIHPLRNIDISRRLLPIVVPQKRIVRDPATDLIILEAIDEIDPVVGCADGATAGIPLHDEGFVLVAEDAVPAGGRAISGPFWGVRVFPGINQ